MSFLFFSSSCSKGEWSAPMFLKPFGNEVGISQDCLFDKLAGYEWRSFYEISHNLLSSLGVVAGWIQRLL